MRAVNVNFTGGVEGQPGAWDNSQVGQSARVKRLWQGALLAVDLGGEATFGHVPVTNAVRTAEGGELEVRIVLDGTESGRWYNHQAPNLSVKGIWPDVFLSGEHAEEAQVPRATAAARLGAR